MNEKNEEEMEEGKEEANGTLNLRGEYSDENDDNFARELERAKGQAGGWPAQFGGHYFMQAAKAHDAEEMEPAYEAEVGQSPMNEYEDAQDGMVEGGGDQEQREMRQRGQVGNEGQEGPKDEEEYEEEGLLLGRSISLRIGAENPSTYLAHDSRGGGFGRDGSWGDDGSGGREVLVNGVPRESLSETWLMERYVLSLAALQGMTWCRLYKAILHEFPDLIPRLRIMASLGAYPGPMAGAGMGDQGYGQSLAQLEQLFPEPGKPSWGHFSGNQGLMPHGATQDLVRLIGTLETHQGQHWERKQSGEKETPVKFQGLPRRAISNLDAVTQEYQHSVHELLEEVGDHRRFLDRVNTFVRDQLMREMHVEVQSVLQERQLLAEYRQTLRAGLLTHFRDSCALLDDIYRRYLPIFQQLHAQHQQVASGRAEARDDAPAGPAYAHVDLATEHQALGQIVQQLGMEIQRQKPALAMPRLGTLESDPLHVQTLNTMLKHARDLPRQATPQAKKRKDTGGHAEGKNPGTGSEVLAALKRNLLQLAKEPPSPQRQARLRLLKMKLDEQEQLLSQNTYTLAERVQAELTKASHILQTAKQGEGARRYAHLNHPILILEELRDQLIRFQKEMDAADVNIQEILHRKHIDLQNRYLARMQRARANYNDSQGRIHQLMVSHGYYLAPFIPNLEAIWSSLERLREHAITQVTVKEHDQDYQLALRLYEFE
jgi:hypothetical protein